MSQEKNKQPKGNPYFSLVTPYSSHGVLDLGVLSIHFSFRKPVAFDYLDGVKAIEDLPRHSSKHINEWRDFRRIEYLPEQEFDSLLLTAISKESQSILESGTVAYEDTNLEEQPSKDNEVIILNDSARQDNDVEEDEEIEEDEDFYDEDDNDEYDEDEDEDDWAEPDDPDDDLEDDAKEEGVTT